jgi:hypothetical protein
MLKSSYSRISLIVMLVFAALSMSYLRTQAQEDPVTSPYAWELEAGFAADWMETLYRAVEREAINPPNGARIYGYAGITLYESVMPGMPENRSLAGQLNGLPDLPLPEENAVYDWASSANGALATVLPKLFVNPSEETLQSFAELREVQIENRSSEVGEDVVERSIVYGEQVGEAILDWVALDNYTETREMTFDLWTGDPSYWVPTSEGQKAVEPFWGQIRPFALEYTDECAVWPDMYYSSEPDSVFYAQATEVMEVGNDLTEEQREIARYWLDMPKGTGTPAGHWVSIENQMVEYLDLDLNRAAEMYGMMGMTLADSFISCWSLKYQIMLLRPVSYINQNISRSWKPYIETPGFPEYPSGHSVVSAAAADMMTFLFGPVAFEDRTHVIYGHEPLVRSFTSFEAAADEAAISRLYGGIHYRSAIENGKRQGRCIAEHILDNIVMRPLSQGE